MPTPNTSIDSTHDGDRIQLFLQKTGDASGSLLFRSWAPGRHAAAKPDSERLVPLYGITVSDDCRTLVCKVDVAPGTWFDPELTCTIVPPAEGVPATISIKTIGVDQSFPVDAADFQEIVDFLAAAAFPTLA